MRGPSIIGNTYKSNNFGYFTVIGRERRIPADPWIGYKVRFIDTGFEMVAKRQNILNGQVKDCELQDPVIGNVFESISYGAFEVVGLSDEKCNKTKLYTVRFLRTGYTVNVQKGNIYIGEIRDPYYPIKCGVACMGNADTSNPLYKRWSCMISRCYYTQDVAYARYGGRGVTVDPRWLCFENFVEDAPMIPGYDPDRLSDNKFQLDKDKHGGMLYSVNTCEWLSAKENNQYKRKMVRKRKRKED